MYMARPRQCNKDVNIQQHRHGQSLSASLTSSLVTGREFASTRKEGMPSTYSNSPVPLNPRRASSDIALPRLLPLRSANARATASTSSSIVSVVRIMASYHQSISLSRAEASGVHPRFFERPVWPVLASACLMYQLHLTDNNLGCTQQVIAVPTHPELGAGLAHDGRPQGDTYLTGTASRGIGQVRYSCSAIGHTIERLPGSLPRRDTFGDRCRRGRSR